MGGSSLGANTNSLSNHGVKTIAPGAAMLSGDGEQPFPLLQSQWLALGLRHRSFEAIQDLFPQFQ